MCDCWTAGAKPGSPRRGTPRSRRLPRGSSPVVERDGSRPRAFLDDVRRNLGRPLIDVRTAGEYSGELDRIRDRPDEQTLRAGHIPTAVSIPWTSAVGADGRFRSHAELSRIYDGIPAEPEAIVYCRIGERAAHTWFVLTFLLGMADVRNYKGSWTEWANSVRTPIVKGAAPGQVVSMAGTAVAPGI